MSITVGELIKLLQEHRRAECEHDGGVDRINVGRDTQVGGGTVSFQSRWREDCRLCGLPLRHVDETTTVARR